MDYNLIVVHLVEAYIFSDFGKYISALLLYLTTMLHLELPHISVFSNMDLIENYGRLTFKLELYNYHILVCSQIWILLKIMEGSLSN